MNTLEVICIKKSPRLDSHTPSARKAVRAPVPLNLSGGNYGLNDREVAVMPGVKEGYETDDLPEGNTLSVNNCLHGISEKTEIYKQVRAEPGFWRRSPCPIPA